MHFVIKPNEREVILKKSNNEVVKIARLLPAYSIMFLYKESKNTNVLKYHTFEYSVNDNCIYFDDSCIKEDTVISIEEDKNVYSIAFLEEFEFDKF